MTRQHSPKRLDAHDTHPELPLDPDASQPGAYKWPPDFTIPFVIIVFVSGCFGTFARYWISLQLPTRTDHLPIGTLVVNLLGAFLLGLLLEGLTRLGNDAGALRITRLAVGTGFMGAFTTYSTFAVETTLLLRNHDLALAACYACVTILGGIICSALGIWTAASHHKLREANS